MTTNEILNKIRPLIKEHFEDDEEFVPGESTIRLSRPTFAEDEVLEAIESLLSSFVTMGEKVERFEDNWSEYLGSEYAHMVNSGSSANLLAFKALEGDIIEPGDEVIVPAVAWSTSLFPILDIGATPVLVDVNPDSYTIDVDAFEDAVTEKTSAAIFVHLLGNPCDMNPLLDVCEENDITVIEDCCEAHGAAYDGQKVGTFGELGTFSFFFSHHISTIEGGVVVTDDEGQSERVRMARAHGWIRELDDSEAVAEQYPDIDRRFLFANHGYNLRPTDIQGGFGLHQLPKLDGFVTERRSNAKVLTNRLDKYEDYFRFFEEKENAYCSWFAFPFQVRDEAPFSRDEFQQHLEDNNIETRPILAGNLANQPVLEHVDHRIAGSLTGAQKIHENGLFIGNHHRLTDEKLEFIASTVENFADSKT